MIEETLLLEKVVRFSWRIITLRFVNSATITGTGNTTITLNFTRNHGFNKIKSLSITNPGAGYNNAAGVTTTIYAADLVTSPGDVLVQVL